MKILRAPFLVSVVSLSACGQSAHPVPTVCPSEAPTVGSACNDGLTCRYPTVAPCPDDTFECVNGQFVQRPSPTCNPPAPPPPPEPTIGPTGNPPPPDFAACPASPPPEGAPCQGDLDCRYGESSCDPSYAHLRCEGGAMRQMPRPSCNPPEPTPPVPPESPQNIPRNPPATPAPDFAASSKG
jgi:hypothetical protein